uniref:Galectin n=1 Tax=Sinocyclocheilus rhinocerous TaxID=307959 RepID=A0A673FWK7_9TELE
MTLFQQLPFFNSVSDQLFKYTVFFFFFKANTSDFCSASLDSVFSRFQVDLMHGSDIVLHFNLRYVGGSEYVVHNTCQYGHWGSEERKYETPFPRGQMFALQILVTQETTNGKPFSEYKHRMPFSHVDSICIGGMVELSLVAFQYPVVRKKKYFTTSPLLGIYQYQCVFVLILIYIKMVPYKSTFCGGVHPGKIFIIQGFLNPGGNRFDNIILSQIIGNIINHLEIRQCHLGKNRLCLLCAFQVTIFSSHDHYKVFVNGEQTHTYSHRFTKLEEIDVLEVSGDVELTFVFPNWGL